MTIRRSLPSDAAEITAVYLESAAYHSHLEPERYRVPDRQDIEQRYRTGGQHPPSRPESAITLVAEQDSRNVANTRAGQFYCRHMQYRAGSVVAIKRLGRDRVP